MFSSTSLSAACLFLASVQPALAHMEMRWPLPLHSKFNPDTPENKIDYSMTSPLKNDGTDFPCKGYQNDRPFIPTASYTAGQAYNMTLAGSATHEGGSCQLSLSYDNGATFKVIKSMIGGCPLVNTYDFTIPSFAPAGDALFAWTWQNRMGNREMYMNCAQVSIAASNTRQRRQEAFSTFESLPYLWKANLPGINGCETTERVDPVYPNPGSDVVFGAGLSDTSIPFEGECDAPQPFGQTFRDLGDTPAPGDAGTTTSSTMSETASSTDSSTSTTSDSTETSSIESTATSTSDVDNSSTSEPEITSSTSSLVSETTSTTELESSAMTSDLESSTTLMPETTTSTDSLEPDVSSTTFRATASSDFKTSTTAPPLLTSVRPPFMNGTTSTISFATSSQTGNSTTDQSMSSSTRASAVNPTSSTSEISSSTFSSSTSASTTGQSTTGASSATSGVSSTSESTSQVTGSTSSVSSTSGSSSTSVLPSSATSDAPSATQSVFTLEVSGVRGIANDAKGAVTTEGTFRFAEDNTATILALLQNGQLVDSNGFAASVPTTRKRQESADGARIFFVSTQDASFEACVCKISSANALSCTCDLMTGFKIGQGADLGVLAIGNPEGLFDIFVPEAAPIEISSTTTSASSTAFETSTSVIDSSSTTLTSSAPGETSTSGSTSATGSTSTSSSSTSISSISISSSRISSESSTASSTASGEASVTSSSTSCTTTATVTPTTSMTSISSSSTATTTSTDSFLPPFATADPNSRTTGYAPCVPGTFLCTSSTTWLTCDYNGGSLSSFAADEYVWKNSRTVAAGTECLPNLSPYTNLQGNFEQQSNTPEGFYRDDRYVRASPFGRCSNNGELRCADDGAAFQVCDNGGWVAMGNVAAGTICSNGEIVAA